MPLPFVKSKLIDAPHGFYGRGGIDAHIKPVLLKQVHGNVCLSVDAYRSDLPEADALVTSTPGLHLAIKTADCAPILFAAPGVVGAAHAGWQGAFNSILESTILAMEKLGAQRAQIRCAIGPCIAQKSYEVGEGFEAPFVTENPEAEQFFKSGKPGKLMFDLPGYCAWRLARFGIPQVEIMGADTLSNENTYFSHRRGTLRGVPEEGRQLSVISLSSPRT